MSGALSAARFHLYNNRRAPFCWKMRKKFFRKGRRISEKRYRRAFRTRAVIIMFRVRVRPSLRVRPSVSVRNCACIAF